MVCKQHNGSRARRKFRWRAYGKWLGAFIAVTMVEAWPFAASAQVDKQAVSMSVEVGYSGYYSTDDWVPVHISLHHNGAATTGDLAVAVNESLNNGRRGAGVLKWPIALPRDGWTSKEIALPGSILTKGATVSLIVGDATLSTAPLTGNAVSHVALVGVISDDPQETQFLAGASSDSTPVLPVALDASQVPVAVDLLAGLSAMVASIPELSSLSTIQQNALREWVKEGGLLIVTGAGSPLPGWPNLPLIAGAPSQVSAQPLADFAGVQPSAGALATDAAAVRGNARIWAGSNQIPLLASEQVGRGQIWQTAFSPMDPHLLAWTGDAQMWTAIFRSAVLARGAVSAVPALFSESGALSLTSVGDALAPLRMPSLSTFGVVFFIYILVAGPLAFFWLHRRRKATWAWVVLPVLSAMTTVGIYAFGGSERPKGLLLDGVGVIDLSGDGSGLAYAAEAFMSPDSGDFRLQLPGGSDVLPLTSDNQPLTKSIVTSRASATDVSFYGVPRWHVRYLYTSGIDRECGEIATQFTDAYGLLFGTVENDTPYTLEDVAVVWKGTMVRLGTLIPGQTKTIPVGGGSATVSWISDYGAYNRALTHGIGRSLGAYLSSWTPSASASETEAMLIATTANRTPQLPTPVGERRVTSAKTLTLIREYAPVSRSLEAD
ncbi:hypothetical protein [Alicyclobacillus hesperidum]|uniref:hypothetical protein n=1 Tax=Alicyclobacillus hesperidum TaxID=89784 RepID=UPI0024931646|nr:hypothetical protein [Alicyclobacillus hesperidum]